MRWTLLVIGIAMHTMVMGQSTLKIFVTTDDARSDMDIIDLNTSSIERYGQSVDSTNINFYTTTMSTQVLRMSRIDLFGPEEDIVDELIDSPSTASTDDAVDMEMTIAERQMNSDTERSTSSTVSRPSFSKPSASQSSKSDYSRKSSRSLKSKSKTKSKSSRPKKSRKIKRYRGQCPKFF